MPRLRRRKPVRRKQVSPLLTALEDRLGVDLAVDDAFLESAEWLGWRLLLVDRHPIVLQATDPTGTDRVFLTLRGLHRHLQASAWVEVDRGAISFLLNGADCMGAGIHAAAHDVREGDFVWIRDQTHGKPLALGWALEDGAAMVTREKGKSVQTIHWIGDELWELDG